MWGRSARVEIDLEGRYQLSQGVEDAAAATGDAAIRPRAVLSAACGLPAEVLGLLNIVHAGEREAVRRALLGLTCSGALHAPNGTKFPGVCHLGAMREGPARALLSIAAGTADGLDDAAGACRLDPQLAEGLTLVGDSGESKEEGGLPVYMRT